MWSQQISTDYEHSPFIDFIIDKRYRWIRHFLLITAIIGIHFVPTAEATSQADDKWVLFTKFISILILLALFYVNHYILIPKFMLRSRFLAYAGSLLLYYALIFLGMMYFERQNLFLIEKADQSFLGWADFFVFAILLTIFIAAVSSVKLFKTWIVNLIRLKEFQNNTLMMQLEQLKSQINPHFLFNTLNNINFLIDEDPKLASSVLMRLSDILRNQLYLAKGETIALGKELEVLRNILFMEDIRRDNFQVEFWVDPDMEALKVPPFLFIPFVENVIKHAGHQPMDSGMHVYIHFTREDHNLLFTCRNTLKKNVQQQEYGGIGLSNIRKRLEILYPNRFSLDISDKNDVFEVCLSIPIVL